MKNKGERRRKRVRGIEEEKEEREKTQYRDLKIKGERGGQKEREDEGCKGR